MTRFQEDINFGTKKIDIYTIRGLIEKICFGSLKPHDLNLTKDMVKNSTIFKDGDVLINYHVFLIETQLTFLKNEHGIDTYLPLKTIMIAYDVAVTAVKLDNKSE